ncbi:MAG: WbqC family protein [Robiginitomaculum sp.]|nr:WbqC family protein [Robiginitomaculum sp.]
MNKAKKSIAIMQPVYLPWLGYFEQMALCDEFMFLDDVQYTKQDWRNRNRIRTKDGWMWLTIPIKRSKLGQRLNETQINHQLNWRRKHLAALEMNYKPCRYYTEITQLYEAILSTSPDRLIDLTIPLIITFARYMSIETEFTRSSDLTLNANDKQSRVLELCNLRGADIFYTGPSARDYMENDVFAKASVKAVFQNYQHPVYNQHFQGFESHMSIIDLLMNHGPNAREILLSSPKPDFVPI